MGEISIESLRCLVVDDHKLMRSIAKDHLVSLGVTNIDYAEDGKVAYEKLNANIENKQSQYNIVFLDWSMPEVDGYTILMKCRKDVRYDNVAFVMLTSETEKERVLMALKNGATAYIQKPFPEEEFKKKFMAAFKWLQEKGKNE